MSSQARTASRWSAVPLDCTMRRDSSTSAAARDRTSPGGRCPSSASWRRAGRVRRGGPRPSTRPARQRRRSHPRRRPPGSADRRGGPGVVRIGHSLRLSQRPREDGRRVRQPGVEFTRRHRTGRRRRLPPSHRPCLTHDHLGRGEHLPPGGREPPLDASAGRRRGRDRRPERRSRPSLVCPRGNCSSANYASGTGADRTSTRHAEATRHPVERSTGCRDAELSSCRRLRCCRRCTRTAHGARPSTGRAGRTRHPGRCTCARCG
ncbi:MAG: hypothetical protein RI958_1786 [Actinomycetota bacterium]